MRTVQNSIRCRIAGIQSLSFLALFGLRPLWAGSGIGAQLHLRCGGTRLSEGLLVDDHGSLRPAGEVLVLLPHFLLELRPLALGQPPLGVRCWAGIGGVVVLGILRLAFFLLLGLLILLCIAIGPTLDHVSILRDGAVLQLLGVQVRVIRNLQPLRVLRRTLRVHARKSLYEAAEGLDVGSVDPLEVQLEGLGRERLILQLDRQAGGDPENLSKHVLILLAAVLARPITDGIAQASHRLVWVLLPLVEGYNDLRGPGIRAAGARQLVQGLGGVLVAVLLGVQLG
mmetsp:Transcript_64381/g.184929  ORF Transcript_64381/g.184929 Transcript_64381/m.184929 type:complete len:284 (-) Transcript_64381:1192-2043(-)